MSAPRLTKPLRDAIASALEAALAGEGFEGGDFDGLDREAFERAAEWIAYKSKPSRLKPKSAQLSRSNELEPTAPTAAMRRSPRTGRSTN